MPPALVVEALDVGEDVAVCLIAGCILAMMNQFGLERVEEALHRGVVVAVGPAAHGRPEAGSLHQLSILG